MPSVCKKLFFLLICCIWSVFGEWTLDLEYSTTGEGKLLYERRSRSYGRESRASRSFLGALEVSKAYGCVLETIRSGKNVQVALKLPFLGQSYDSLGTISLNQRSDGNYTGVFRPKTSVTKGLKQALLDVSKKPDEFYYVKADNLRTFNYPCLLLRSNLAHTFALTIDTERRQIYSLTVFPQGIYDAGKDQFECDGIEVGKDAQVSGNVVITKVGELPTPDTASYLQRLEDEKRARQHGASQDNRSFLAKYVSQRGRVLKTTVEILCQGKNRFFLENTCKFHAKSDF